MYKKRTATGWYAGLCGLILSAFPWIVSLASAQELELVWSDEFEGTEIDATNWTFDIGGRGWGNEELQYYTSRPENARVENGCLIIEAREERYRNLSYTSARLKTERLHSWAYGKFEARIKIPYGQGMWPAFWILGDNVTTVGWPECGEIDIMENIGRAVLRKTRIPTASPRQCIPLRLRCRARSPFA